MSDLHLWQGICLIVMVVIVAANHYHEMKGGR